MPDAPTVCCSLCGRMAEPPSAQVPLGWMLERDGRAERAVCPPCAREHVRAIEGKLDQAWW
jgi:hypothetical protein